MSFLNGVVFLQQTNGTSRHTPAIDPPRDEMHDRPSKAGTSAAAQSRRAKNAAHRADDVGKCLESGFYVSLIDFCI